MSVLEPGWPAIGPTPLTMALDLKRVTRIVTAVDLQVVKLSAYLDGQGSGSASQAIRAVIYSTADALVAVSEEVVIADNATARWVDFSFLTAHPEGVVLAAGSWDIGLHAGGATNTIRAFLTATGTYAARHCVTDTYADGSSNPFGTPVAKTEAMAAYIVGFNPRVTAPTGIFVPFAFNATIPAAPDVVYARQEWATSQRLLNQGVAGKPTRVEVGWYGLRVDRNEGAYAVVRQDGPLEDMVGEVVRLKVGNGPATRTIVVYVLGRKATLDEDIAITRRAFFALTLLSERTVRATMEVLGGA